MNFLAMFQSFFAVGLASYGGGIVSLGLIFREVVQDRGWLSPGEMSNAVIISQLTPGPIAVNTATYTGYILAGIPGALFATFAVVLPALIILTVFVTIRQMLRKREILDRRSKMFARFRHALRPGIFALLLNAGFIFSRGATGTPLLLAFFLVSLAIFTIKPRLHPVVVIMAAGLLGMFLL